MSYKKSKFLISSFDLETEYFENGSRFCLNQSNEDGKDLNTGTKSGSILKYVQELLSKPPEGKESAIGFNYDGKYGENNLVHDLPASDTEKDIGKIFKNGDYKLTPAIKQGALNIAAEIIEVAKVHNIDLKQSEFSGAADLDGNSETLTKQELASYILAGALASNTELAKNKKDIVSTFDNKFTLNDFLSRMVGTQEGKKIILKMPDGNAKEASVNYVCGRYNQEKNEIADIGRQIFGDNFQQSLKTNSVESDKAFTDAEIKRKRGIIKE